MSMEIHVFFRGTLPNKAALGRTMKELGFPLSVTPARGALEGHSGYMPMRLKREETGVEFDLFEGRSAIDEFGLEGVDPSLDRVANFRWGGDDEEMLAALCGAAALAKLVNGIVFDEAGDRLLSPDQAIEMAKEHVVSVRSVARQQAKLPGTRPADIKRYLKPLLALRPDLVLIDRRLIIRPVRHLLRGVFFDRTSDKYTFQIWPYLRPLYGGPRGVGDGTGIHGWFWSVWQPFFRPLLLDCLAEDVFASAGKILTLEDFANEMELVGREARSSPHFCEARVRALVLAGEGDRAREYVDQMERSDPDSSFWPVWAKEQREFLGRDIEGICNEFHAREAKVAEVFKLVDVWEPTPFPVELPAAERGSQLADPLFRPTPWIPRQPGLFGDAPEAPGEMRFAKSSFYRRGRLFLVVPLTPEEAEDRHRKVEPYVLAARLEGGIFALLYRDGTDSHDPDRPKNWVPRHIPGMRVQLHGSDHVVRARCPAEWDKKLQNLFHLEVDKGGVRDIWSCYFDHEDGARQIHDYRTGDKVYTNTPLTSPERDLTMFPPPEFGHIDELVRRILGALRIAGYDEFT